MNKEDKISRLNRVSNEIDSYSDKEYFFDAIEKLLKDEYDSERIDTENESYLSRLKELIDNNLDNYKSLLKKRPKKGALTEYNKLIKDFGLLVLMELIRLKRRNV